MNRITTTALTLLLSALSSLSHATGSDIAKQIIQEKFPDYRLVSENDFNKGPVYGVHKNNASQPGVGDLNRDTFDDIVFVALKKESKYSTTIEGKEYYKIATRVISCHGSKSLAYTCFTVHDSDQFYPLTRVVAIARFEKTDCPYDKHTIEGEAITIEPALGNIWHLYWFDGTGYVSCSFGD